MYSIFDSLDLLRPTVFVVSDAQYKDYQDAQRRRKVEALKADLAYYEKRVAEVQAKIAELEAPPA